ncbi:MAG: hypothetical protein LBV36_00680 [Chromatiales bacterium]|nr:hypothetical protein [Chromatiales bacterium]
MAEKKHLSIVPAGASIMLASALLLLLPSAMASERAALADEAPVSAAAVLHHDDAGSDAAESAQIQSAGLDATDGEATHEVLDHGALSPWDADLAPAGYAGDEAETPEEEASGPVMQAIQGGQAALTRGVVRLSRGMDRMLGARQTFPDEAYDSVLRARIIQRFDDAGGSGLQPSIGGRLSLPGAEERWSLIFLSDDYNDPLDRERGTNNEVDPTRRRSIAVRYLPPLERWKSSLSAGLRTGPIDALVRGRLWREFYIGIFMIRPTQTLFWYEQRGSGASSDVRLEYPIGINKLLRSDTGATWFNRDRQFYYDHVFSFLHPLNAKSALLWQFGVQAESEPNANVTNYYAQVRWRSLVYSNWLIFEMRPQLIRERENDFRLERRFYIGFELLFGLSKRSRL